MKTIFKISIAFNLLIIAGILYLAVKGRDHVEQFLAKNILDVRHEQMLSMFRACPDTKGAIIFLGNSITEGGNWEEIFQLDNILNRGIGGDVTAGVLARMDEIVRHEPSKLFICIGTNDLARGVEIPDIIANYHAILETVREASPETVIYVQSVLPVGEKVFFGHNNDKIKSLNEEIKKMCAKKQITYIDLHPLFAGPNGYLDSQYTNDELHLLGGAYLLWKDKIAQYVYE
jgi:hexosaminidase